MRLEGGWVRQGVGRGRRGRYRRGGGGGGWGIEEGRGLGGGRCGNGGGRVVGRRGGVVMGGKGSFFAIRMQGRSAQNSRSHWENMKRDSTEEIKRGLAIAAFMACTKRGRKTTNAWLA